MNNELQFDHSDPSLRLVEVNDSETTLSVAAVVKRVITPTLLGGLHEAIICDMVVTAPGSKLDISTWLTQDIVTRLERLIIEEM